MPKGEAPISIQRLDASVVYEGNTDGGPVANIVFVHGLGGDPHKTWLWHARSARQSTTSNQGSGNTRNFFSMRRGGQPQQPEVAKSKSVYWPAEMLPEVIPDARIITYGYDADVLGGMFQSHNQNSILQHGNDLMVKIERSLRNEKPIIFVAHSLGGLVVKTAINRCRDNQNKNYKALYDRIRGVIFCGTPHRGCDSTSWAQIASNIASVALYDSNKRIIQDLEVDSQILDLIQDDFLKLLSQDNSINVHTFQEGLGLSSVKGLSGKTVGDFSSKLGHPLEVVESINANHRNMVKFGTKDDAGFRAVSGVLAGFVHELSRCNVLSLLEYLDFFKRYKNDELRQKIPVRHSKTCQWLTGTEEFRIWYSNTASRIFWLNGYPGVGKSVAANYIYDYLLELRTQENERKDPVSPIVCYFFCLDTDERTQRQELILGSIIHQILDQSLYLAEALRRTPKYRNVREISSESAQELWKILRILISSIHSRWAYIVLDGLDEMNQQDLEPFLKDLVKLASPNTSLSVFATSRPEKKIRESFDRGSVIKYDLGQSANNRSDVFLFLADTVEDYSKKHFFDTQSKRNLLLALQERSDGLFLRASLAWQHFVTGVGVWSKATLQKRIARLQELPKGLNKLYHCVLMSIDLESYEELYQILRWLVVARRPLSFEELSVALALNKCPQTCAELEFHKPWSIKPFLEDNCPYLFEINQHEDRVSLGHQSFKDFLLQTKEIDIDGMTIPNRFRIERADGESQSGRECLIYIGLEDFRSEVSLDKSDVGSLHLDSSLLKRYTFLSYAHQYWSHHLKQNDDSDEVWNAFENVVESPRNFRILCISQDKHIIMDVAPVFIAFRYGLKNLLRKLVLSGHDINQPDQFGNPILHNPNLASDSLEIKFALSLGADINVRDGKGQTVLLKLLRHDDVGRVRTWLKEPGVDVNAQDNEGLTPLHATVFLDPKFAVQLLDLLISHYNADVNIRDKNGRTPLVLAIHWGKESVAKAILGKANTSIQHADRHGENPLINAAKQGSVDVLHDLLQRLDSVDRFIDHDGQSILHWTVSMRLNEHLAIALQKQISLINAPDNKGMTALHVAAREGELEAVELLLTNGGSTTQKTALQELPLHLAAGGGHRHIVKLLLDKTPREMVNDRDTLGCTLAHWATTSGNDRLIQMLAVEDRVDLTLKNKMGRTPVATAAEHASLEAFKAMLSPGDAQMTQLDYSGNTLIHLAASMSNVPNTTYLVTCGQIDKNARNRFGKTALDKVGAISRDSKFYMDLFDSGLYHSASYAKDMMFPSDIRSRQPPKAHEVDREGWSMVLQQSYSR